MKKNEISNNNQVNDILKKTSRKMTLRIVRICIQCLLIFVFIVNSPYLLQYFQSNRIQAAQQLSMLYQQFSSPANIVGYSTEKLTPFSTKVQLGLYSRETVGKNLLAGEQLELKSNYNLISGKIKVYYPIIPSFMHIVRYEQIEEKYKSDIERNNQIAMNVLERNRDTTVALMDISFPRTYTINEIASLIDGLDLEVEWLAIETGLEDRHPSNMGMPAQQFFKWGIPTKLYTPNTIFNPVTLEFKKSKAYLEYVIEQLFWAEKHSNLLAKSNLSSTGFNEADVISIGHYLEEKGFNSYGLRVNGPSDQLLLLAQRQAYLKIDIVKIDVWYWDN